VGLLLVFVGRALLSRGSDAEAEQAPARAARLGMLERVLDRVTAPFFGAGGASRMAAQLDLAGFEVRPQEWIALRAAGTALGFVLSLYLTNVLTVALLVALAVFLLPNIYLRLMRRRRMAEVTRQLPEAMILMANALESGSALVQSMQVVAEGIAPPIRQEFARVDREMQLGIPLEEALDHMTRRLDSRDLGMLVNAIQIHRQLGGSLAEILRAITETIRERVRLAERIRVLTAQSRASAYIITALPVVTVLLLLVIAPGYMNVMFTSVIGVVVLIVCLVMIAVAFFLMARITDVEI